MKTTRINIKETRGATAHHKGLRSRPVDATLFTSRKDLVVSRHVAAKIKASKKKGASKHSKEEAARLLKEMLCQV